MRKIILLILLIGFSIALGISWKSLVSKKSGETVSSDKPRQEILRFALVADSENANELLTKALNQAKGSGVNFVIGLGDWSNVGTTKELTDVKKIFDNSGLVYYVTAGDHDLWDSRNRGDEALTNFKQIFGNPSQSFTKENIHFVILDNSDIYKGMQDENWKKLDTETAGPVASFPPVSARSDQNSMQDQHSIFELRAAGNPSTGATRRLTFVFAHKTPFHPQSAHVMGEDTPKVAEQAKRLMNLLENAKVNGFFSGDLHFFAQFNSPGGNVKMTTIGAIDSERNFQGPRFAIVTVYGDYSWNVEDIEIR